MVRFEVRMDRTITTPPLYIVASQPSSSLHLVFGRFSAATQIEIDALPEGPSVSTVRREVVDDVRGFVQPAHLAGVVLDA